MPFSFACLLPVLLAAVQAPSPAQAPQAPQAPASPPAAGPAAPARGSVVLDGSPLAVPVTVAPAGPLFALRPLAESLGGEITPDPSGESVVLKIGDTEVVVGFGSAIVTVGDEIVSLSQPVTRDLQVPVDFLQKTYGTILDYTFDWRPELARLTIARRQARDVPVLVDVVHLQGMTTVVLQFSETPPRYDIARPQPGTIEVRMLEDRLAAPSAPKVVQDPFVQEVTVTPQAVRIQLAAGVVAQSYILDNPFRLVFDVHQPSQVPAQGTPAAPVRPRAAGVHMIVLDPGHGGTETGAIGPSGVYEKDLTLTVARELEARLESRLGVQVALTRNEDVTLPHDNRTALANQNKADLFVSIHLNSSLGAGAHGAETYFLSQQATDSRAASSAASENADASAPDGAGPAAGQELQDLQLILWDLAQSYHLAESQRLANMIQAELNQALQLRDRGVKQAPFRVLKGAAMPAVLVELGFISNPDEEKKLQDGAYRAQLVDALTRAIARYKAMAEGREMPADLAGPPGAPGAVAPAQPGPQGQQGQQGQQGPGQQGPAGQPAPPARPPGRRPR